jgi:hypothetical protein
MTLQRSRKPRRIVGHPDLAAGAHVFREGTLYISVAEAIYRQHQGEENVEVHFLSTEADTRALKDVKEMARRRWENDHLPDGWAHPKDIPDTDDTTPPDEFKTTRHHFSVD